MPDVWLLGPARNLQRLQPDHQSRPAGKVCRWGRRVVVPNQIRQICCRRSCGNVSPFQSDQPAGYRTQTLPACSFGWNALMFVGLVTIKESFDARKF